MQTGANNLIGPVVKSFTIYIAACLICDNIRKSYPERIIQSGDDEIKGKKRCNTIQTALVNLGVGAMMLFFIGPYIQITSNKSENNLLFIELLKLGVMLFVADTMFYWSHRLMHIPWLFKIAHRQHHTHHEPIPWTSLYVHPVEFIIAIISIFVMPLLLFSLNPMTATAFLSIVMISLVTSHSGLNIGILNSTHHDIHHQKRRGNYGSDIGIWDRVCGTQL